MIRLGVALIIIAFLVLLGVFAKPEVLTPLTPLYCQPGETLTSHTFTFSLPSETSISFYFNCTDATGGVTRDVSEQVTWSILGIYLAVFGAGIALTTIGGSRRRKERMALEDEAYRDTRRKDREATTASDRRRDDQAQKSGRHSPKGCTNLTTHTSKTS